MIGRVTKPTVTLLSPGYSHATLYGEKEGKNDGGRKEEEEEEPSAAGGGEGEVTRHAGGSQNSSGHDGGGDSFIPFPRQHGRSVTCRSGGSGLRGLFPLHYCQLGVNQTPSLTPSTLPYPTVTDSSLTRANKS